MISPDISLNELSSSYSPSKTDLDVDLHLLSVRTLDEEEIKPKAGLVFHRPYLDVCFLESPSLGKGNVSEN